MQFLKFQADRLFTGYEILDQGEVLITDALGRVEAIVPAAEAGEGIRVLAGTLCPGFVNSHCHLELSHLRGKIPERTGMTDFLLSVMGRPAVAAEVMLHAMRQAEQEMLEEGIVAVGDICNTPHTIELKKQGRLLYHNFIELAGFPPGLAAQRFEKGLELLAAFRTGLPEAGGRHSLAPHAPYSVSTELLKRIISLPGNHLISQHSQESAEEEEFLTTGTGDLRRLYDKIGVDLSFFKPGGNGIARTLPYLEAGQRLLLVHNVMTSAADLELIRQFSGADLFFCLCPNANLYINGLLPDLALLADSGFPLVFGTDSLASNQRLSILCEINSLRQRFQLTDAVVLRWATLEGAKALQMEDLLGSFERGKKPGVIQILPGFSSVKRIT